MVTQERHAVVCCVPQVSITRGKGWTGGIVIRISEAARGLVRRVDLHAIERTAVREREISLEELQRRHKVRRTTKQPVINPPARTAVEIHPVPTDYGSAARDGQATHRWVTSSSPATKVVKSNQLVATVMQREPEPSATASRHTTSPAARRGSPAPRERRGSPNPRSTSRSYTRSRSPVRSRRGGSGHGQAWSYRSRSPACPEQRSTLRVTPGRAAPQERGRPQSPERGERRSTLRATPGRSAQQERHRSEWRRDDRQEHGERDSAAEPASAQLLAAIRDLVSRVRD